MTREDFIKELQDLVKKINSSIPTGEETDDLFEFVCEEVLDRVIFYLNYFQIDEETRYDSLVPMERIIARVISGVYTKLKIDKENGDVEQGINSMSDNGQSVNFSDKVKLYLNTATDQEVFTGFTDLLNTYRLATVLKDE
ncbi:MAG: hypothetical protein PHE32_04210 [Candidatus Shapirobacteria bacterium]|nr:hypothetical protein [Candidatus Shapirobacteria bacterium]